MISCVGYQKVIKIMNIHLIEIITPSNHVLNYHHSILFIVSCQNYPTKPRKNVSNYKIYF
jgi:hypothetical protein